MIYRTCLSSWRSVIRVETRIAALIVACLLSPMLSHSQTAEWIWGATAHDKEIRYFRKIVQLEGSVEQATLSVSCDNAADVYVNGKRALRNTDWSHAKSANVTSRLKTGANELVVIAHNEGDVAGLLLILDLKQSGGRKQKIVSDASWETVEAKSEANELTNLPQAGWVASKSLGQYGINPWGDVLKAAGATPAESLQVLSGFKAELIRTSQPGEGSWVSMTVDPKGRLIVSPQGDEPILRITLDAAGQVAQIETIDLPVRGAMGLLHAFGSLYVNGQGKEGYHLYRLRDTDGDDRYDTVDLLRRWSGGAGEHGAHGIVLGKDGKIYSVNGNFVDVPKDIEPSSQHKNYQDDLVLPRMEDGNGFGAGRKPPGGFVVRMDPDGSHCELFASGQRNTYDIAFNPQGELFGFDSDMEWDWGMPWYRPTRVFHIVSGADQGFREGSGKWPEYYPDSLPATVNIGIGCPTGVRFGTGAKFPARYQRALFVMDWSYGRIIAVHLREAGASYMASFETFVKGKPLNVTDLEIGPDGAMYFLIGGRGTQAALYRVSYVGNETVSPAPQVSDSSAVIGRAKRHELETLHGVASAGAVGKAWSSLGSSDRWIRYAARLAIEAQPVSEWKARALAETNSMAGLHGLLALARMGEAEDQLGLLKGLARWPLDSLDDEQKMIKLRVIEVSMARHGLPPEEIRQMAVEKLSRQLPASSWPLNRELTQILTALNAPDMASRILALRDAAPSQEEKLHYQSVLRKVRSQWSDGDHRRALTWLRNPENPPKHPAEFDQWFADVGLPAANGASFNGFLKGIRREFAQSMSAAEAAAFADLLQDGAPKPAKAKPAAPRSFVKEWHMDDVLPALPQVAKGRNFERGKAAFEAAQCIACHKMGNDGGAVGPDLTSVISRFSRNDILSSILEPSKVVSEQYENTTYEQKDGEEITGRLLEERSDRYIVLLDPLKNTKAEVKKSDVKSNRKARLSPMPEGLVNTLQKEEILDLLAYLESMGNANHKVFKP